MTREQVSNRAAEQLAGHGSNQPAWTKEEASSRGELLAFVDGTRGRDKGYAERAGEKPDLLFSGKERSNRRAKKRSVSLESSQVIAEPVHPRRMPQRSSVATLRALVKCIGCVGKFGQKDTRPFFPKGPFFTKVVPLLQGIYLGRANTGLQGMEPLWLPAS
jgi:hypothetical protein